MTTHVYFDFFGTLVDYDPSVVTGAVNAPHNFAVRAGVALDPERATALWQRAWAELDGAAERSGRECSMHEIADRYRELLGLAAAAPPELDALVESYLSAWTAGIRLASGARECLADLSRDTQLSVVSNTHHSPLVPQQLARFGIAEYFEDVVTSIDVGWRKPRPELFQELLERHGVVAARAAFVGDTWEADVAGPQRAGMRAFYVGRPSPGKRPVTLHALPELIRSGAPSSVSVDD